MKRFSLETKGLCFMISFCVLRTLVHCFFILHKIDKNIQQMFKYDDTNKIIFLSKDTLYFLNESHIISIELFS